MGDLYERFIWAKCMSETYERYVWENSVEDLGEIFMGDYYEGFIYTKRSGSQCPS